MLRFLKQNPQNKNGVHRYALEEWVLIATPKGAGSNSTRTISDFGPSRVGR